MLEIIGRVGCKQNVLIYVKKVTRYPTGDFYWVDGDMLDRDPAEPLEDFVHRKACTGTTEESSGITISTAPPDKPKSFFFNPIKSKHVEHSGGIESTTRGLVIFFVGLI